jgi:hypothetical protein
MMGHTSPVVEYLLDLVARPFRARGVAAQSARIIIRSRCATFLQRCFLEK